MLLTHPIAFRDPADLVERQARVFAQWLRESDEFPAEVLRAASASVNEGIRSAWLTAVAEEWLLASNVGAVAVVPDFLRGAQPFAGGPSLEVLAGFRAAVAVIPLDQPPRGASARVWVLYDPDRALREFGNAALEGTESHFPVGGDYRVFIAGHYPPASTGPSWQLGAVLAQAALARHLVRAIRQLAAEWMVTGRVSPHQTPEPRPVASVRIGTKSVLPRGERDGGRRWLLPLENQRPSDEDYRRLESLVAGRLYAAHSVSDAWNLLTGEGAIFAPDQAWPEDCEEVHGFVSHAQGPFLALILQGRPKRVVYWVSPEMAREGLDKEITAALGRVYATFGIPMPEVSAEDLPDATRLDQADLLAATERALAAHPELARGDGPPLVFNNTGGNFLHRTAALRRALLNSRIWLPYRDTDDETRHFTLLRGYHGQILTGRLLMKETRSDIDWLGLVRHRRLTTLTRQPGVGPTSADQISALVNAAIRKREESIRGGRIVITAYLFSFAAKGLQSYIMRGGKLRDMVGATSLIDRLATTAVLEQWLEESFGIPQDRFEVLQAAAGSARIRFSDEAEARAVAGAWPLWCQAWAPDLEVVQQLEPWDEARSYGQVSKAAAEALERRRNFPAVRMPEAGPFVKRAPRTGEPAAGYDAGAEELVDHASQRKRAERRALRSAMALPPVVSAFGFTSADQLPDDFEQISGGGAYLAVIHADGNRLGQKFLEVGRALAECPPDCDQPAIALFRYLSQDVVAEGTRAAARKAVEALPASARLEGKPWLIAPIVLAGDDLTVVCRADLGLPFTEAFLKAFSEELRCRLAKLRQQDFWATLPEQVSQKVPHTASAGAGVVFCTDHYPFALAYELCESLAHHAKSTAKSKVTPSETPPSALSFVRITGASVPTDFEGLAAGILRGSDGTLLTSGPYFLDDNLSPRFTHLQAVFDLVRPRPDPDDPNGRRRLGLPGTSLRGLLSLQRTDSARVPEAVERMKEVAGGYAAHDSPQRRAWDAFEAAWKRLCGWPATQDALSPAPDWKELCIYDAGAAGGRKASPLHDLLTLLAIRDKTEDDMPPTNADAAPA